MHDRRIDGKTHTFGNFGVLYMQAMTWWDHETDSVWSQPIGTAIQGSYRGTRLVMIPAAVVPWGTWRAEHPETLVLEADSRFNVEHDPWGTRLPLYVLGVVVDGVAKAYPWVVVSEHVVVNDRIGGTPVVVYANPETRSAHIYARRVRDTELDFEWDGEASSDLATGSIWDLGTGHATAGPLKGESLEELPYSTAFDWAWKDFYPETQVYPE